MFSWKDFLMGQIKKFQKHKEEKDRSGKFKKEKEKKNGEKKKKRFLHMQRVQYKWVLHWLGTPLDYRAHATLPLENPSYGDLPYNFMQAPGGFHLICLYFSPMYVCMYVCMYEWLVNFLTKRFKNIPSEMLSKILTN